MKFKLLVTSIFYCAPVLAWSAEPVRQASSTGGLLKMLLGLVIVLGIMAAFAWFAKRMLPGIRHQQSAIQVVGSVHVGTRERVVVLEVSGRWLVVGVAPGQVSAIANLDVGVLKEHDGVLKEASDTSSVDATSLASSFGKILKNSASKLTEKTNG